VISESPEHRVNTVRRSRPSSTGEGSGRSVVSSRHETREAAPRQDQIEDVSPHGHYLEKLTTTSGSYIMDVVLGGRTNVD
jgi:hypothetical protein